MIDVLPESPVGLLEQRLARGADLLFDMEQRGDTDSEYQRFLLHYEALLEEYERTAAA